MSKISHVEIRMYRMGTGDCFALKFFKEDDNANPSFKMLIDAGTWSGAKAKLTPYIESLKEYLDDYADVMVITHEHKDHVHAFDACEDLFCDGNFKVGEIWFGWPENDKTKKVKDWKEQYGEKKKALGQAAFKLNEAFTKPDYLQQFEGNKNASFALKARKNFSEVLNGFADLHLSIGADKVYKGGLDGMEVVKNKIPAEDVKHFNPGDIISDLPGLESVNIYVLGPPKLYSDIKKESGEEGESYRHNDILMESDAFGVAVLNMDQNGVADSRLQPFDDHFTAQPNNPAEETYKKEDWRKIDYDWLYSSGSFALRMNSLTNNLSLALAIEFENGKVMLFPGDAEYGSWNSWHKIKWEQEGPNGKHFTEDLLNRTVFYKVAHHLSHNGTAEAKGLDMMKSKDLIAMATLDYNVISSGWTGTMPNRAILKDLLQKTKGRLIIMNEENLFYDFNQQTPLSDKIEQAKSRMTSKERKEFKNSLIVDEHYKQYTLNI